MRLEKNLSRSRKGAWIEIAFRINIYLLPVGRSRKGAWIEIVNLPLTNQLSVGRSRKGAWIEILATKRPGC